jgi:uncharacterized membrane protein HdeD (DUF308 family)
VLSSEVSQGICLLRHFSVRKKRKKMNQTTKIAATVGVVYGLYFSMKGNKGFVETALFVLLFGAAGVAAGTAINKLKPQ